ncbi:M24 family metallopeptidase [Macrococcoides caseolyticum]|uniref:M24 family metallopeptidase n=1 Tax=Macrococcoides caseolyticum TaxID=69966 RepID=UPI001F32DA8E|nr:Xaa-Pro peptidase family protein [Macrococcus caseolyticus]MCE4956094.1 aminopeptidase P family protein [Macrococcus caseolyticus]
MKFEKLNQLMNDKQLDAMVIISPFNRRYLSGFTGSSGALVISKHEKMLVTDFRYIEQATAQASQFEIIKHTQSLLQTIVQIIVEKGYKTIGFEGDLITYQDHQMLLNDAYELINIAGEVERIRMIKEPFEIEIIQQAADIADETFNYILEITQPGMTELQINNLMEMKMRELGATSSSFDTIVASGVRGALPHGVASNKVIQSGEMITFDYGAIYNGYISDITRTIAVGQPSDEMVKIYNVVLESQMKALNEIKIGMTGIEADKIARDVIQSYGYGDKFGHSLGHGIGLEVHEGPMLSMKSPHTLEENMCVTLEPGIYVEGLGGVRIEDDVLVTKNGLKRFTQSPKDLIIL